MEWLAIRARIEVYREDEQPLDQDEFVEALMAMCEERGWLCGGSFSAFNLATENVGEPDERLVAPKLEVSKSEVVHEFGTVELVNDPTD